MHASEQYIFCTPGLQELGEIQYWFKMMNKLTFKMVSRVVPFFFKHFLLLVFCSCSGFDLLMVIGAAVYLVN